MNNRKSLARWILGSAIGLIAVVQALRSLGALASRGATLGVLALASLAALTVLGLVSLGRARRRIERELVGLMQRPADGELVRARKARLAKIAETGGTPDREALADASAASERGQAYLGRYLVAVAVLIGLVGTFSGLAEALRGLPAILGGVATDPQKLAGMLAGPLAGIDVTFAAGIVGILSTLALALVQGDLQLHEELALARLEEETTHELIPSLWPSAQSVEERTFRELTALRNETRGILVVAGNEIGARIAEVTTQTSLSLASQITAAFEASTKRIADELARSIRDSQRAQAEIAAATTALSDELRTRAEATAVTMGAQLAAIHREIGSQAEATQLALTTEARRATVESTSSWQQTREALIESIDGVRTTLLDETIASRAALLAHSTAAIDALASSVETTTRVLTDRAAAVDATIATELGATRSALIGSIEGVRATLVEETAAAREALAAHSAASITSLERTASAGAKQLADVQRSVVDALAGSVETTARVLTERAAAVDNTIATELGATRSALIGSIEDVRATLVEETAAARQALAAHSAASITSLEHATTSSAAQLAEAQRAAIDALVLAVDTTMHSLAERAIAIDEKIGTDLGATRVALTEAATQASTSLAAALSDGTDRLEAMLTVSRSELDASLSASRDAIDGLVRDSAGALGSSAATLAQAAEMLAASTSALSPQLEALVPELHSLGQEVALLGTRNGKDEEPLFADELVRLGEGMERLEAMVQLAQGRGESAQG